MVEPSVFGELAISYLFLGGAGAAGGIVLAVLGLCVPREAREGFLGARLGSGKTVVYQRFFSTAYVVALLFVVLGVLCLVFDLGHPTRALSVLTSPSLSIMNVGAYALVAAVLVDAALCATWMRLVKLRSRSFTALLVLSAAVNLVVMVYTALLLGTMEAVPFWSNGWVPALFLLSSASCGLALVVGSVQLSGAGRAFGSVLAGLMRVDAVVILVEMTVLVAFTGFCTQAYLPLGSADLWTLICNGGFEDARRLIEGDVLAQTEALSFLLFALGPNSPLLWGGVLIVGLLLPLVFELAMIVAIRRSPGGTVPFSRSMIMAASSFCVLLGGFLLRWCIVFAGVSPAALLGA